MFHGAPIELGLRPRPLGAARSAPIFSCDCGRSRPAQKGSALQSASSHPGRAGVHVRFLLLLDFAAYLLSYLYDPLKVKQFLGRVLPFMEGACSV